MDFSDFVASRGQLIDLEAGEHVFHQGDDDRSVYVLRSGLLKAYYLSDEGKERVKSFIGPGDLIASLTSAYRKEGCSFGLVSVEASTVVAIDFDTLYEATQTDLAVASAVIRPLLEFAMKKERREREFLTESAEERYRLLMAQSPDLSDKVKQKDIARYLGITPVALSRIRARSAKSR